MQELRQNGNAIPFILFTGKGREEVAIKALNLGADRYFNKVGDPETVYGELAHCIRQAVAQRRAEQKIWDSEERIRAIFASSPDAMVITDMNGIITDCSLQTLNLMQVSSKADLIGKGYRDLIVKEDHPKLAAAAEKLLEFGHIDKLECKILPKNGSNISVEYSASLLRDAYGSIVSAVSVARDITERKAAEDALRSNERRFRELTKLLPETIYEADSNGVFTFVNNEAYIRFGYTKQEFEKGLFILQMIAPEDHELVTKNFGLILCGELTGPTEYLAVRKDGTTFPIIVKSVPVVRDKKIVGIQGIMVDITNRKKVEDTVKETLKTLEKTNEKLGVIGKFARHDTRNKLSVILNHVYLAKHQLASKDQALTHLEEIESAVYQIEKLFDFLRFYEKLGTQDQSYVSVDEKVEEAFLLLSSLDGIHFMNECNNLTVRADSLLRQVFYNLIENSLKHGETVTKIRIHYKECDDGLELIYEDDGVGISLAEKELIFNEGYGKGTGYGLYLIKKICEAYGWTIVENSTLGKGAKFVITMPRLFRDGERSYKITQPINVP